MTGTIPNPDAGAEGIPVSTSRGINNEMQGTAPFHADQTTASTTRMPATEQQWRTARDTLPSGMNTFTAGNSSASMNQTYRSRSHLEDRYLIHAMFGWLEKRLILICYERKTLLFR